MKKTVLGILFSIFSLAFMNAQVREQSKSLSMGVKNALIIDVDNVSAKTMESEWKSFVKDINAKTTYNRKTKEWLTEGLRLSNGGAPVNMITKMETQGAMTVVSSSVDLGNGVTLSSMEQLEQYRDAEKLMRDFKLRLEKAKIQEEFENEEKKMKKMESHQKSLEKKKENLLKDIENYKEKIKKAESDIETNKSEQEGNIKAIENQQKTLDGVKKRLDSVGRG